MPAKTVEVYGVRETELALAGVAGDVEGVGGPVAEASIATASELAQLLKASAAASPTPVARRVARSITVRAGRHPTVSIGGAQPVGRDGAPAYLLAWGSEHGPAADADVNHFAAPRGAGYWIKPATDRVAAQSWETFDLAVAGSIKRHGL